MTSDDEALFTKTDQPFTLNIAESKPVLNITPDGHVMRRGRPIEELSQEGLLELVYELIEIIRGGKR